MDDPVTVLLEIQALARGVGCHEKEFLRCAELGEGAFALRGVQIAGKQDELARVCRRLFQFLGDH